jgi:hypothetical protein
MPYLLAIDYSDILVPAIIGLIIWFFLLRAAVRADTVVKNQEIIIDLMIRQYKKQGATEEELDQLKQRLSIKKEN